MAQVVTFPVPMSGVATWRPDVLGDEEYWAFCEANRDLHVERTAKGEIVIMPPAGGESDYRNAKTLGGLDRWSEVDGRGRAFGPSVQFFLPDGSGMSPDAAWVSNESLGRLTKQQRKKYLPIVPEFIIEVLSPSDRLKAAKAKMEDWMANSVDLGWLIDGDRETVYMYRQGRAPRARRHIKQIAGEGPVKGFVLNLVPIWQGLQQMVVEVPTHLAAYVLHLTASAILFLVSAEKALP